MKIKLVFFTILSLVSTAAFGCCWRLNQVVDESVRPRQVVVMPKPILQGDALKLIVMQANTAQNKIKKEEWEAWFAIAKFKIDKPCIHFWVASQSKLMPYEIIPDMQLPDEGFIETHSSHDDFGSEVAS